jgi:hypothetical protein
VNASQLQNLLVLGLIVGFAAMEVALYRIPAMIFGGRIYTEDAK